MKISWKFLFLFTCFLATSTLSAQIGFGLKSGVNANHLRQTFTGEDLNSSTQISNKFYFASNHAFWVNFKHSDLLSMQIELLFSEKGYHSIYKNASGAVISDQQVGLFYLGLPVLERFRFSNLSVDVGVQPSYLFGHRLQTDSQSSLGFSSLLDKFNLDVIAGLNYHIKRFTIGARYDYSALPFLDISYTDENGNYTGDERWFTNALSLSLSYQINRLPE